ncbi:hypothetical protein GMES_2752 [Paraglaciecola mesophila KMM 241]|uniref:Glycosyltransferase 2-like domain-containing protein n=1 Tax=Paraglaciecola mesophila KMM 241 TaxID=1128912 RepID=K6Z3T5_9ALTE|nr:glycosyltransferase family 2 protein [Paraglaciecola mesophila]GAC25042.1 hypothetical protein GMES_2752 [Paraglaciecola mesophila KMM 241]
MQVKNELVSVVIPTFGRCEYLARTIRSVLSQTYTNIEAVIVDDNGKGSAQGAKTAKLMSTFSDDSRVKYVQHEHNLNGSAARNTGISVARGSYIAFLDDDDEFCQNKISLQVEMLEQSKDVSAVYCLNSKFYNGNMIQTTSYTSNGDCQLDVFCLKTEIHTSSLLIHKKVLVELNGFDTDFARHQDFEFLIRFFENNKIACLPQVLLKVNVESTINRPDVDKLIAAKEVFFRKLEEIFNKFDAEQKERILKAHNFELFRVCLKNMDMRFIKFIWRSKPNYSDLMTYFYPPLVKYIKMFLRR